MGMQVPLHGCNVPDHHDPDRGIIPQARGTGYIIQMKMEVNVMTRETRLKVNMVLRYVILLAVGVVMVYPLIWMIRNFFMTNEADIFKCKLYTKGTYFQWISKGFAGYQGMTLLHSWQIHISL